jgi:hypothetical protein
MLPRPYPDELIGSVISRGVIRSGDAPKRLLSDILGRPCSNLSFFLPSGLNDLAWAMGLSPRRLLWEHTVFPYVAAFMPPADAYHHENKALEADETKRSCSAALVQSVTSGLPALRYCPKCTTDDIVLHGESFWHRRHCLPAVHVCVTHGCPLRLSDILATRSSRAYSAGLPQHQAARRDDTPNLPARIVQTLAQESTRLLNWELESDRSWMRKYRTLALERGYVTKANEVGGVQMATDLGNQFGVEYLTAIGCSMKTMKQAWPSLMVRPGTRVPFVPVKHVLLRSFLLHCADGAKELAHRSPGRVARDLSQLDLELAKEVRRGAARAMRRNILTTVKALVQPTGQWQAFRHHRDKLPMTNAALQGFRQSEASERKLGGREGHQRNIARRQRRLDAQCD